MRNSGNVAGSGTAVFAMEPAPPVPELPKFVFHT